MKSVFQYCSWQYGDMLMERQDHWMVVNGVENTMCLPHDVFFVEVKTNSSQQKINGQLLIIFNSNN